MHQYTPTFTAEMIGPRQLLSLRGDDRGDENLPTLRCIAAAGHVESLLVREASGMRRLG